MDPVEPIQLEGMDKLEHFCYPCTKYLEAKAHEVADEIDEALEEAKRKERKIQEFLDDDCC